MTRPEWVEAGVRALKDTWAEAADTDEDFAAAVIAAVEPLIRADERNRMTLPEWTQVVADARTSLRSQIAADIEALADDWSDWSALVQTNGNLSELRDVVKDAIHDAARIARGESIRADERERMALLHDYDPVPGLVARGVVSDDHDPDSCEADCCFAEAVAARLVEVIGRQHVALAAERRYIEEVDRALVGRTAEVEALRESLDTLRAQIAADIAALALNVSGRSDKAIWYMSGVEDAARIARGES